MRIIKLIDQSAIIAMLFLLTIFLSISSLAIDQQGQQAISITQDAKKSVVRKLRERRHTFSATRQVETMPLEVFFSPTRIRIMNAALIPKSIPLDNGFLDLESLRPAVIKKLTDQELSQLLSYLATFHVKITWRDREGKKHVIKDKKCKGKDRAHSPCNAAAALTLKIGSFSFKTGVKVAPKTFARMVATLPDAILPAFQGLPSSMLDVDTSAEILARMMTRLDEGNSTSTAQSACLLAELFINPRADKDADILKELLGELIEKSRKIMESQGIKHGEHKTGILLGAIFSGMMKYAHNLRDKDQKNQWIMGSITNIIWAATSFIGMLSIATSVGAAASGGISMAAVLASVVYGEVKAPRDFTPDIKEVEGQIEISLLESAKKLCIVGKVDVLMLLAWMRAAIHVNGLQD